MRAAAIVTGVLGAGTVIVFAVAALAGTLFPSGTLVNASWNGGCFDCGGWGKGGIVAPAMPVPAPILLPPEGLDAPGDRVFVTLERIGPGATDNDVVALP